MTITHTNRKGKTYYLHERTTKTGKKSYYFSMKDTGTLVDEIPEGFEIYEHPNGQVFLRRIVPQLVSDEEVALVEQALRDLPRLEHYRLEVKGDTITVLGPDQDVGGLASVLNSIMPFGSSRLEEVLTQSLTYTRIMRFMLIDEEKRTFAVERYCFRGSVDDWIPLDGGGRLRSYVEKYIPHLGKDSFYNLYLGGPL